MAFDSENMRPLGEGSSTPAMAAQLDQCLQLLEDQQLLLADLRGRLRDQSNEIAGVYDHSPIGMALFGRDGRAERLNRQFFALTGIDGTAEPHPDSAIASAVLAGVAAMFAGPQVPPQQRVITPLPLDQGSKMVELCWYPVLGEGGVVAVGCIADDVTDRVSREEQARQMLHELQHRVKNSLANVLALVEQARRSDAEKEVVLDTLRERMRALSRIHALLTEANWSAINLGDLLDSELRDCVPHRCQTSGPPVMIGAQAALAFATALHELAANARRFGALSSGNAGQLRVDWHIDGDDILRLVWHELGYTTPDGATGLAQMGFGSRLIVASINHSLRGVLEREVDDSGLTYRLNLPMAALAPRPTPFVL